MKAIPESNADTRSIWLIRHGLRLDVHDPEWIKTAARPHDTPLSPDGFIQAEEVGRRLANENIEHLFASPFLRAMQTADRIAHALPPGPRIKIEHGLCEAFFARWFPIHPTFPAAAEFARQFHLVDASYNSMVHPQYPEETAHLSERAARAIRAIVSQTRGNLAIVTHGGAMSSFVAALLGKPASLHATCCCLVQLQLRNEQWHLERDGKDTSHLSKHENVVRFA